ncbi:hypothetical protein BDW59DRAFT_144064 [Aspergillus cavernicola]|uniref:Alpha/Beta hydrolase protein n=1 Tax=Aspergillus cavernicola TaxID=176166 RepID=A0ABR4IIL4_9EURO
MLALFRPPQSNATPDTPLPYTASPWRLLWEDILLAFRSASAIPGIFWPLMPYNSGDLDELYPSPGNIGNIAFHLVLSLLQIVFLVSIPVCIACMFPALWVGAYIAAFLWSNRILCNIFLNRGSHVLKSRVPEVEDPGHSHEHWIFINGIATGQRWLQSNIDRLGYTFGRRIIGLHNPTAGLVFDIIQCIIQRDFSYATPDVRDAYALVRVALLDQKYTKVVLIVHSQGGIEGGLIADWLLDEIPQGLLRKLEIYTFANAANHFNNPYRALSEVHEDILKQPIQRNQKANEEDLNTILHIEHYANSRDFVSVLGVLNFTSIPNRFMGRLFIRLGSGHMFNQHYMDNMFTLGTDGKVLDSNDFMDMEIDAPGSDTDVFNPPQRLKVKDLSRLWLYRNGGSPEKPPEQLKPQNQI